MSDAMIYKIAVAIGEAVCPVEGYIGTSNEYIARCVLEAMREPTEHMIASCGDFPVSIQEIWSRLIGAALSEAE